MNWRFTLTDYTFDSNGISTVLSDEPFGWDSLAIKVKRDLKTHGITFEESVGTLGFWGSGMSVLSTAYNSKGTEANTEFLVEIACNETYEEVYTGKFIYAKAKFFYEDDCYVIIPVEQTGCLQTFRNRIDQKVDLLSATTIDGTPLQTYQALPENISIFSKPLIFRSELNNASDYSFSSGQVATSTLHYLFASFDYEIVKSDIENTNNASEELFDELISAVDFRAISNGTIYFQGTNIQCSGVAEITIRLKGTFTEFSTEARTYLANIQYEVLAADGTLKSEVIISPAFGGSFGQSVTNQQTFDITYEPNTILAPGDKVYVYLNVLDYQFTTGSGGASNGFDVDVEFEIGEVNIEFQSQCHTTDHDVFLAHEALSRTAEIISDDCLKVYSEYFGRIDSEPFSYSEDGCAGLTSITNGLLLRGTKRTDEEDPKLFTSFKELFDGFNTIHCLGMGIEDTPGYGGGQVLRIERFDYFYDTNVLLTFNDPKKIQIEVDADRIYALINVGYKKWETDYYGGLDEIQTQREYKTDITATDTKLQIESNFIASTYAIELTKRTGQTTEDFKYDNDIFIICLDRIYSGFQPDWLSGFVDNILSSQFLMNYRISPVRNLMRWFKFISPTWNKEYSTTTKDLIFSSGTGNYVAEIEINDDEDCILETQPGDIIGQLDPDRLAENGNINKTRFKDAATYADPISVPQYFYTEYPLSYTQFQQIKTNPYKKLSFTQRGNTYSGWIVELDYTPAEGLAKFKMLMSYP